jgi:hypothetical protein
MVRAPNQGARTSSARSRTLALQLVNLRGLLWSRVRCCYFAPEAAAYFLRNLSTRPAVSTIFCLPV